ncbi:MAG: hypothetical protein LBN95_12620 [Prevotellaceae bacterium]|jgi:MraZ protein|nr:hypothetical protein [Prevotellaceae bacterium]
MALFFGKTDGKLDEKGRVMIPSQYRKQLADENILQVICRFDAHLCSLSIYTPSVWEEKFRLAKEKIDENTKDGKQLLWQLFSSTEYLDIDAAGRILLNKSQREEINIEKEVLFAGMGDYFTITKKENHKEKMLSETEFEDLLSEKLKRTN